MFDIKISEELKSMCPEMVLGTIFCTVKNSPFNTNLWEEIDQFTKDLRRDYEIGNIKNHPVIKKTREVYKACGKDPNRYRPAAEALRRRLLRGFELYKVNTLVDTVNLISLKYGYSIGGFDADNVVGNVVAGIGRKDEHYEGIGRGPLNIEGLPVQRDDMGGIGTPTSDEVRTAISLKTSRFYMNINGYLGKEAMQLMIKESVSLLKKYVGAENVEIIEIS